MNLEQALEWYAQLASVPGWKAYVWHQVNQLASDHPVMFRDLPSLLTERMKARDERNLDHSKDSSQEGSPQGRD